MMGQELDTGTENGSEAAPGIVSSIELTAVGEVYAVSVAGNGVQMKERDSSGSFGDPMREVSVGVQVDEDCDRSFTDTGEEQEASGGTENGRSRNLPRICGGEVECEELVETDRRNGGEMPKKCVLEAEELQEEQEELEIFPEKGSRRSAEGMPNLLEISKKNDELCLDCTDDEGVSESKGKGFQRSYSRSELEVLRFVDVGGQQRRWKEVYQSLGSVISQEYDGIHISKPQKQARGNDDRRRMGKKASATTIQGEVFVKDIGKALDVLNISDHLCDEIVDGIERQTVAEEPCSEDDSSSDEYDSIQRPAFLVEGEPDFESGPPLDGLEYLRRVRWEAAQIPKVKVANLNLSKFSNKQTPYMPNIPEILKWPQDLLPTKHWEDTFLADFSEIRQAFLRLENSGDQPSMTSSNGNSCKQSGCIQLPNKIPTVTALLGMDAVSRAATLRNCISMFDTASVLLKDECLWMFALCVAVDTPLHADTSASLRCLVRKCASILAGKSEPDDEVAMLNILVTVSGKYFGQLEN